MGDGQVLIAIMAAGSSKRFNGAKLLAAHDGTTLLNYAVNTALHTGFEVVVVTGCYHDEMERVLPVSVPTIFNSDYETGMASSIRHAAHYAETLGASFLLIMAADQPAITSRHLQKLVAAANDSSIKIAASAYAGVIGIPAIFYQSHFKQLQHLQGDEGAKRYLKSVKAHIKTVFLQGGEHDIDTVDELKKLEENQD